jgi:polyphosphate kinase 2 (PPK2 family)
LKNCETETPKKVWRLKKAAIFSERKWLFFIGAKEEILILEFDGYQL